MNTLDVDVSKTISKILNIAFRSVWRAAFFMGLGINVADDHGFKQYPLAKITGIEFIHPPLDENTIAEYKKEFKSWIIGNGLRELIETFCVFLDEIHLVYLLVKEFKGNTTRDQIPQNPSEFKKYGLCKKLKYLKKNFNLNLEHSDHLVSLNKARNCMTHGLGIVRNNDCTGGNQLVVKWIGIEVYAETPSGEIISLSPMPEGGVYLKNGGKIKMSLPERTKIFPLRSKVTFSPRELAEICNFILSSAKEVTRSVEEYILQSGALVEKSEKL